MRGDGGRGLHRHTFHFINTLKHLRSFLTSVSGDFHLCCHKCGEECVWVGVTGEGRVIREEHGWRVSVME